MTRGITFIPSGFHECLLFVKSWWCLRSFPWESCSCHVLLPKQLPGLFLLGEGLIHTLEDRLKSLTWLGAIRREAQLGGASGTTLSPGIHL